MLEVRIHACAVMESLRFASCLALLLLALASLGLNRLRRLAQIWKWLPQVAKGVQANKQFTAALEGQQRDVMNYLEGLSEADLQRKARIPLFKEIMGIEEIDIPTFVGALFDYHWNDHAGQIAKIRKSVGLPEAK